MKIIVSVDIAAKSGLQVAVDVQQDIAQAEADGEGVRVCLEAADQLEATSKARAEQLNPDPDAATWLILAGRGWGKTYAAAHDIGIKALRNDGWQIAVVAPERADVRDICFEGESGLLDIIPEEAIEAYNPVRCEIALKNGAIIRGYAGNAPGSLIGRDHHAAWFETPEAMKDPELAWERLRFGLRLGAHPQAIVSATPNAAEDEAPGANRLLTALAEDPGTVLSVGSSYDNVGNLPIAFERILMRHEGTSLAESQIHGRLPQTVGR